jgi:hypothetical protein
MKRYKLLTFCWLALLMQLASASPDSDLLAAAKAGNAAVVESSLAGGANPNQQDDKGTSPLMWAAYQGNLAAINALLNADANINAACANLNLLPEEPIKYRDTPLGLAVSQGHLLVVQALIAKGANQNAENNLRRPALLLAAQSGNTAMVRTLIDAGANLNAKGGLDESTPLIEAVKTGNQAIADLLIKAGAEVDTTNKNGESALGIADTTGLTKIAALMKGSGAKSIMPLYIRVPLLLALFFIAFAMSIPAISRILPSPRDSISNKTFSFIISCTLATVFVALGWQTPQAFDAITTEIFSGFTGMVSSLVSILFLVLGVNLFFEHISAFFGAVK